MSRIALSLIAMASALVLASCSRTSTTQKTAASAAPTHAAPVHATAAHAKHWSYEGDTGPAAWGSLSPEYVACAEGTAQSPIDIASASAASVPEAVTMRYGSASLSIDHHEHVTDVIDNGHTIQVNCAGAGSVTINGKVFELAQFHFHAPSEHTVDGKSYPMEMHLVHQAADGTLAVIGALIEEGKDNAAFDTLWAHLPAEEGQEVRLPDVIVDVDRLLPAKRDVYRYDGSLTTPPCSEGVQWLVMKAPIALSHEQIAQFRAIIHDNNRPTQPLEGRVVAQASLATAP